MADQIFLSLWFETDWLRLNNFEKTLELFPFSMLRPGISFLRVYAINFQEPILLERAFDEPQKPADVIAPVRDLDFSDLCVEVDGYWDLWMRDQRWELAPVPVRFIGKGPAFEDDQDDQIRIDFGIDSIFLPQEDHPEAVKKSKSNLTSLMRFAHDLDDHLPLKDRRLWVDNETGMFEAPEWVEE